MNFLKLLSPVKPRTFIKISASFTSGQHPTKYLEVQNYWRQKDDIPKRYQLIYKAPMEQLLNYTVGYLTISTVTIGVFGGYYAAFIFDQETINTPVIIGENIVIASSGIECLAYLGAFFAFHTAVKILLSKYVIRLYQDDNNYVAVFRGHMFNSVKKHEFKLNSVKKLNPIFAIAWADSRFILGNKKGILLENYFKTPEYYNKLVYKKSDDDQDDG